MRPLEWRLLLKETNLNPSQTIKYRPISNLPFLSKILEMVLCKGSKQLHNYPSLNNLYVYHSAFRADHCPETALIGVINNLKINSDTNTLSILMLLDLSVAFDTVDHDISMNRLENSVGPSST